MDKIIEENGIIYAKIINLHKTTDKDIENFLKAFDENYKKLEGNL